MAATTRAASHDLGADGLRLPPSVGCWTGVIVGIAVDVGSGVGVSVGVGIGEGVAVSVGRGVAVGSAVAVGSTVAVGSEVGAGVRVATRVGGGGVGLGDATCWIDGSVLGATAATG